MNKWIKILCCLVLSVGFLFTSLGYAALTDTLRISGSAQIDQVVFYTVTYLVDNEVYAVDQITDNSVAYTVRKTGPNNGDKPFKAWVNANAVAMSSIPAGNTHDYTLSATWSDIYLILFADVDGSVVYQETFVQGATSLSAEGQAIVDQKLGEMNALASQRDMSVNWSEYNMATATGNITVRAIYNYHGYLKLVPVYLLPDDGIVDYYKVEAVNDLPEHVVVPGDVGGIPVLEIDRIFNEAGDDDWNNYGESVKTITIEEGLERLGHNALAYTPNLTTVNLPSTLKYMDKNVFSRNDIFGNDKKKLTINYNGTKADWKALVASSNGDWAGGLQENSVVKCSDGYFKLERNWFSLVWNEYSY
jgi:hypothetical protein